MANTIAQDVAAVSFSGTSTPNAVFGACSNPSTLVAMVSCESWNNTISGADGTNGAYGEDAQGNSGGFGSGAGKSVAVSVANASTASPTFTATLGSADYGRIKLFELTCPGGRPTFDAGNGGGDVTGGTSVTTVTVTTTTPNCTMLMTSTNYPSTSSAVDSGYTGVAEVTGSASYHFSEYDADVGAAGGKTLTWGGSTTQNAFSVAAAAYKPAAAAAAPRIVTATPAVTF